MCVREWGVGGDRRLTTGYLGTSQYARERPPPPCPEETPAAPKAIGRARALRSRPRQSAFSSSSSSSPRPPGPQTGEGTPAAPLLPCPGGCSPQRPPCGTPRRGPAGAGRRRRRHLSGPRRSVTAAGGGPRQVGAGERRSTAVRKSPFRDSFRRPGGRAGADSLAAPGINRQAATWERHLPSGR